MPAKTVIALWGSSGHGKTSLLQTFIEGFQKETGKKVRLYTAESAQMGPLNESVARGWLEYWAIDNAAFPFERIHDATQGAWPEDPTDPVSKVIPAFRYQHVAKCPECSTLIYQAEKPPAQLMQSCPKCKRPVATRVVREINPANGLDKVGCVIYESGTEFGDLMMRNMSDRSAKGETIGENTAARFQDGALWVAGQSRTSYGLAQRHMKNAIGESKHLPVDYVIWTFTKERGQDDERKVPVFGPKLPGSAVTSDVPRWFGPTLSACMVPQKDGTKQYRLYLSPYFETWNPLTKDVENMCNNRIPPAQLLTPDGMGNATVPDFYKFDASDRTLMWRVVRMIEAKQHATEAAATSGK